MNLRAVYRQFRAAHSEAEIAMEALVKAGADLDQVDK